MMGKFHRIETDGHRAGVDKFRRIVGLSPIRRGERECMKCEKKFYSADLARVRMCSTCRRHDES